MRKADFLVIGSGIAGLSFALKAAQHGKVLIVTKSNEDESNTKYAQGGVAVVVDESDSFEKHIEDTLIAGDGLCDEKIVEIVVKEGPQRIQEIVDYGINFDKTNTGVYDLAKEGGHSEHRVLHFKDITGYEIERILLKQIHENPNIEILTHYFCLELITQHHLGKHVDKSSEDINCYGIYAFNTELNDVEKILANVTLMASGGAGHVYANTTNPVIATGDGMAMVYRAKGKVRNMEFIQFHPTALYHPGEYPSFLISEAVRGFGAYVVNEDEKRFLFKYDSRGELATRDIVSHAIYREMNETQKKHVYLDCRHLDIEAFYKKFPAITAHCNELGLFPEKDLIPIVPAAHYQCGGIKVDQNGATTIPNLYAIGECARTGLHGKNRLASNSLLEALVFAHQASEDINKTIAGFTFSSKILIPKLYQYTRYLYFSSKIQYNIRYSQN